MAKKKIYCALSSYALSKPGGHGQTISVSLPASQFVVIEAVSARRDDLPLKRDWYMAKCPSYIKPDTNIVVDEVRRSTGDTFKLTSKYFGSRSPTFDVSARPGKRLKTKATKKNK